MADEVRDKILESYAPVVKGLAEMFGPECEVLLHDLNAHRAMDDPMGDTMFFTFFKLSVM